ncbi:MAG: FkbM family methyltransferase [Paracoccaceae bacterium]
MQEFQLNGINLHIPTDCLTETLIQAITSGRYEQQESVALERHLRPDDRVLDLGAGAGYLSSLAAGIVGGANVVSIEAGPQMIAALQANLERNEAADATVVHGAVVGNDFADTHIEFHSKQAFWASAITSENAEGNSRVSRVPALRIGGLLTEHQPSVVILDIEGGEARLCDTSWPDHVRLLIMEIHSKIYSNQVIREIFDGMSRSGMTYMPWGTRGETVVFQRITPPNA